MDQADIPALISRLASDEDASRKMAAFKLQSSINDPAFADVFISQGGLVVLRRLIMNSAGNTLAYALQSLTRLIEVDMGWDIFDGAAAGDLVERVVELVVKNPLVNILRGAMSILVALVGQSSQGGPSDSLRSKSSSELDGSGGGKGGLGAVAAVRRGGAGSFGFRALKPAVAVYPQFFELVVAQLSSADHALCGNALMLINALVRDAVSNDGTSAVAVSRTTGASEDWSKFIKRLQDLGLIKAVYTLMQSSSLQDLAHPLLEFQSLTKVLLRRWREVRVDLERPEHRRALKGLHLASAPDRRRSLSASHGSGHASEDDVVAASATARKANSRKHDPEKWRRLGFETESPATEFDAAGFLGMMDLTDYVRKNEEDFQKLLLEQSTSPLHARCPVARASLAVTMILYDHFGIDKTALDNAQGSFMPNEGSAAKAHTNDQLFRPLLLQWSRLHTAGLQAFFRLWRATGAVRDDLDKVAELVHILIERVVGTASRTKEVLEVEEELHDVELAPLRELQMDLLDLAFDDHWGLHLHRVREELRNEAVQFVCEQRVRCLLEGSWFPKPQPSEPAKTGQTSRLQYSWQYAKLSHNRRYLHYGDFTEKAREDPGLDALSERLDLGAVSSVVSNVVAGTGVHDNADGSQHSEDGHARAPAKIHSHSRSRSAASSASTLRKFAVLAAKPTLRPTPPSITSKITINTLNQATGTEEPVLTLFPLTQIRAAEWLDGLLMLLNQVPLTAETDRLVQLASGYGLRIRLLNMRAEAVYAGPPTGAGVVPSREGLDDEFYYDL